MTYWLLALNYLLRWHMVKPNAIRLWLSDVRSLQRVSRCSRARAQHSPYLGWAARLCTRRSSILPRSESGPDPDPDPNPESRSTSSSTVAAIFTCPQVSPLSQSQSHIFTSEVTERSRLCSASVTLISKGTVQQKFGFRKVLKPFDQLIKWVRSGVLLLGWKENLPPHRLFVG